MKLSIITVNLNNAAGLEKTAESIVSQTFNDFEWIVIDGGSTDGSKELIEQYSDYIAYWVSEKDSGIYNAMNKGVKHANGEYLQFLNSGDSLNGMTILERVALELHGEDILYGNFYQVLTSGKKLKRRMPSTLHVADFVYSSIGHGSSFIKKIRLMECPYNEQLRIVSDWEFFLKMFWNNKTFRHINEYITAFDASGISSSNLKLLKIERESVLNQYIPAPIRRDYHEGRIAQLISFRTLYPLYGKVITASICLMEKISFL